MRECKSEKADSEGILEIVPKVVEVVLKAVEVIVEVVPKVVEVVPKVLGGCAEDA